MNAYDDIFRFADKHGLRLTRVERRAIVYLTGRPGACHPSNLAQVVEDLEQVEAMFGAERRPDAYPREDAFDAACQATNDYRRRMALVGILSWRWEGVAALQTTRTLIRQEIEARQKEAVA